MTANLLTLKPDTAMKDPEKLPSLDALGDAIRALHKKVVPQEKSRPQGMGMALQLGLELVAGTVVGTGIGIVLDRWLGTSPVFLLVCFFFGTAGGLMTLFRAANAMAKDVTDESDKEK
jgi:ATP synthase protein I